jgi:hypothetical protein
MYRHKSAASEPGQTCAETHEAGRSPPRVKNLASGRTQQIVYQVLPVRQEPEPAVVQLRTIVPSVTFVIVKLFPDFECPTIV